MKCPICKLGDTAPGMKNVTLECGEAMVVLKKVPADICSNCEEVYHTEKSGMS